MAENFVRRSTSRTVAAEAPRRRAGRLASRLPDFRVMCGQLRAAHAELDVLAAQRSNACEDERQRIARDLHDGLQQSLAATRMALAEARECLAAQSDHHGAAAAIAGADAHLAQTMLSVRHIVRGLQPQALARLGLLPALSEMADSFASVTAVKCRFVAPAGLPAHARVHPQVASCIYRVVQEALNNVAKHARARHALIEVFAGTAGIERVAVEDDGQGMKPGERMRAGASGLHGARQRARQVGGVLSVTSVAGTGTRVELQLVAPTAGQGELDCCGDDGGDPQQPVSLSRRALP